MSDPVSESHKIETYKSMITISIELFKILVLINGGAAAGMITAMSSILRFVSVEAFRWSIGLFVVGLVGAALAITLSWFTQNALHNENHKRLEEGIHKRYVLSAMISCIGSLACFGAGAIVAAMSIRAAPMI
jgi:hypothetical protein